jgi:TonB family protein
VPAPAAPPASDYAVASRLDPGPQLLEDVEPVYPAEAGLTEGSVVLRLLIGRAGTVDEVIVVRSLPKGVFDRSAVAAFSAARFSPGRMLGVPVKSQLTIEVHFTPVDRGGNVSPPTY